MPVPTGPLPVLSAVSPLLILLALLAGLLAGPGAGLARESVRPGAGGPPTEISALVVLVDIDAVRDADNAYEASIYYELSWIDPRLDVPPAERPRESEIWTPVVGVANQQNSWTVIPETRRIGPGGRVTLQRHIWASLSQPLKLSRFPFDTQEFRVTLLSPAQPSEIVFVPDPMRPSSVAEFTSVPDWEFAPAEAAGAEIRLAPGLSAASAFVLRVKGERRSLFYVYTMILPLFVIAGMSIVAFWMEPENYIARLGTASTAMLTVVTYRVAMVQVLPRTAYFTDMDVFISGSMLLVFLALVAALAGMMLVRRGRTDSVRRLDIAARIGQPLAFIALTLVAFGGPS